MVEGNLVERIKKRGLTFELYSPMCAFSGFGLPEILEVAHLDGNRQNNTIENQVILSPNYHKMHDIDLFQLKTLLRCVIGR